MYKQKRNFRLISALLCVAMFFGMGIVAGAEKKYSEGEYKATAKGYGGDVAVTVFVDDEKILKVDIEANDETKGIGSNAVEQMPALILENQSLAIDTIAGCTVTSKAIIEAAAAALRQSGASEEIIFAKPSRTVENKVENETLTTDVLIIGAGAAGLSAALSAYNNGVKEIVVIEKMPAVGGATSMAGGGMPSYRVDENEDITKENIEKLFLHLSKVGKFTNNARLTMMQAQLSAPTIEWLKNVGVGITGEAVPGEAIVKHGTEGRAAGAISVLYEKVKQAGITLRLNTRAEKLLVEDGRVTGAVAQGNKGETLTIRAKAVLMATGGYGKNLDLISDKSILDRVIYYGPVGATGDGHIMMKEINVPMFNMNKVATKHFGVETEPGYGIHIHWAVAQLFTKTGAVAVNKECERVVDESGDQLDIALASMYKSSDGRLYIVMDQKAYDLFSSVLVKYKAFSKEQLDQFIEENGSGITKLVRAASIEEAGKAIGLDGKKLAETIANYNADVSEGKADPFKRTFTEPFGDGPYYIMQTVARYATTLGGVNVSDSFEVLDIDEQPVPGLYAAGEVVGNINGSYAEYLIWCFASGMQFGNLIPNFIK